MAEIGRWGGQKFEVKSNYVQGFTGLSVKGSSETEDKESGGEKYVSRKNGKPTEISLTIHLNALTGCTNVRDTAMWFINQARAGKKDYFYIKNGKLVPCQVMLTEASVKEIKMTNAADWICCDVQLTLKQCSKWDGTTASSGGGSSGGGGGGSSSSSSGGGTSTYKVQIPGMGVVTVKASSVQAAITAAGASSWTGTIYVNGKTYYVVKGKVSTQPSSTTTSKTTTTAQSVVSKVVNAVKTTATSIVNTATSVINKLVNAAKAASTAAKTTTTTTTKKTTTTTVTKPNLKNNKILMK